MIEGRDFIFLPGARYMARALAARRRPATSSPSPESNHPTRAIWRKVHAYKYMDDGITTEKVNFENADVGETREDYVDGQGVSREIVRVIKLKHAIPSKNAFCLTSSRAVDKGMKVNTLKTNTLCLNDALSYDPVAYIEGEDGSCLTSVTEEN